MGVSFQKLDLSDYATTQALEALINDTDISAESAYSSQKVTDITGNLSELSTTEKESLVGAINEIVTNSGKLSDLQTPETGTLVEAINSVNARLIMGTYTVPQASSIAAQEITIDAGVDLTNAFVGIDCLQRMTTDNPQFIIAGVSSTGFTFYFLPGGTTRSYLCVWFAILPN